MTGDVDSQQSTGCGSACQEEEVEGVEVGPSAGGEKPATKANAVVIAATAQKGNKKKARVEKTMEKLKTENSSLHGRLVAERTDHARTLMDSVHLRRDRKRSVKEKGKAARLLAAKKTKPEKSVVVEQLKKDVLTISIRRLKMLTR